ncbi:MAG: hypothetical protein AB7U29_12675 [Desulfobulbus sp.]
MITDKPRDFFLHSGARPGAHYDKATEAIDMARGILGVLRSAVDPDQNGMEVYAWHVACATDAALFLAEIAQEHLDSLHNQLLSTSNEGPHEGIS